MNNFGYARVSDPAQAVSLGAAKGTMFVAGGTELLNWMRLGIASPANIVDLGGIVSLRGIRKEGGALWIGALTTLSEIEADPTVRSEAPVLAEACLRAASPQIRNRASLGGNVLQKTRCAYFRAEQPLPWPCNKRRPGSGCAALDGHHERHAIFGWSADCVATQPSDPIVALACLDAVIEIAGARGVRSVAARDFHLSQEEATNAQIETRLRSGEVISGYRVPLAAARRSAYVKVRERESYEYAMVSAAAALVLEGKTIRRAQVALGSVAQRPWRIAKAEAALAGKPLTREALTAAVGESMAEARPLARNAFKVRLAANAAVRAIEAAARIA
jgi:xanthine dehydrogenase YagS FAD-binding subunit